MNECAIYRMGAKEPPNTTTTGMFNRSTIHFDKRLLPTKLITLTHIVTRPNRNLKNVTTTSNESPIRWVGAEPVEFTLADRLCRLCATENIPAVDVDWSATRYPVYRVLSRDFDEIPVVDRFASAGSILDVEKRVGPSG